MVGRILAERLTRLLGQQVVVKNRVGAAGTLGSAFVAKSPPDGYTLLQANIASNAIAVSLYAKMPYRLGVQAITDTIGGQIPINISNFPAAIGSVQSGRLRALAVTSAQRAALLPGVPTMHESGVPGFEVTSWYGVVAPAGTPAPILDKLNADFTSVLRMPEIQQRLDELVVSPSPSSRKEFDQFIRAEIARWAQVIKDAGIPKQ